MGTASRGQGETPAARELLSKFDSNTAFNGIRSNEGQISGIRKYFSYLTPQTCNINNRVDQRLGEEGAYREVNVANTHEYVSIIDILTLVARKRVVMQHIRNLCPRLDGKLSGYIDSDVHLNTTKQNRKNIYIIRGVIWREVNMQVKCCLPIDNIK